MITQKQATDILRSDDLIGLAMEADAVRKRLHPAGIVSYALEDECVPSIAALDFRHGESLEERIGKLSRVRRAQEETGCFVAVNPCVDGTAAEYLKILALSRIYLDNVPNVQTSWVTAGAKVCQIALRFGANDIVGPTEQELRRVIRDAGFIPKQRGAHFQTLLLC
ncbi:MAG: hypothetical protein WB992_08635 [Bryobacteraceae bacterium]